MTASRQHPDMIEAERRITELTEWFKSKRSPFIFIYLSKDGEELLTHGDLVEYSNADTEPFAVQQQDRIYANPGTIVKMLTHILTSDIVGGYTIVI